MPYRPRLRSVFVFAAVLVGSWSLAAADARARSLTVEDLHARVEVGADGVVRVEETIRVRFDGSWNGIFRDIPYGYTWGGGVRGKIQLDVDAVLDDQDRALEYWEKRRGGYVNLKIRVPGASDAVRVVVIRYHAQNVIRPQENVDASFGTMDELYWNVTGNEWDVPIEAASADITLPSTIDPNHVLVKAFTGFEGAREEGYEASVEAGPLVTVRGTRSIFPGQGLTVALVFPPGHVAYPTFWQKLGWWFEANWYVLIPLAFLGAWLFFWIRWGRDPLSSFTIIPEWEPPEGLRATEVGVLVDDTLDQRDLTAVILDLAVRRVITIHQEKDDEFRLELHRDRLAKTKLEAFEKKVVSEIFPGDKTERDLSSLKYNFVKSLESVRNSVMDRLVSNGFFPRRPDKTIEKWAGWTTLVLVGLVVLGIWQQLPWPFWAVGAASIVAMYVIGRQMPRRTQKGLAALARVKGMEEYLVTAEKERMEKLPMDAFERLLPFAVALGLHERWAEAFASIYEQAPEFIQTRKGTLQSIYLYHVLNNMNRSVGSTMMSGPRSQSSGRSGWGGGFSGGGFSGGFSGGGFGGGGGGGW